MKDEPLPGNNDVREFRLEGLTLALVVGVLVLALCGAFYLGRRVERAQHPAPSGEARQAGEAPPRAAEGGAAVDVDRSASYFDKVEGGKKAAEPSREARREREEPPPAPARAAEPPSPAPAPTEKAVAEGAYFVQVWAGRDHEAAELLVQKLEQDGYSVRVVSDRAEGEALYKVRVGGFADEPAARKVSDELESKGYRGAWVTSER